MPVVDASVVVDWIAPDPDVADGLARRVLTRWAQADEPVVGPRLLREEVTNALLTGVRRRRWTGTQADVAYGLLLRLPIAERDVPADRDRAYELSRRHDEHPVYDMVYVALAERLGLRLVTADRKLVERVSLLPFVVWLGDV